jgi:ketosteroid isomerase-like protein
MTPQTETEDNRATITTAFEAWRDHSTAISHIFAPEMTWRVEGHSAASRSYANTQEFMDKVLAPFGARFSTTDPFRPVNIRGTYADGDTVIVFWDGRGTTTANTVYENSYAWFMQMRDGKVINGDAFYDSISFNRLWEEVAPAT